MQYETSFREWPRLELTADRLYALGETGEATTIGLFAAMVRIRTVPVVPSPQRGTLPSC